MVIPRPPTMTKTTTIAAAANLINNFSILNCKNGGAAAAALRREFGVTNTNLMAVASTASSTTANNKLVGPAVKLLLFHYGLEPAHVPDGSGPKKNILKSDVLGHIHSKKLTPSKRAVAAPPQPTPKRETQKMAVPPTPGKPTTMTPPVRQQQQQKKQTHLDIPLSNMRQTIAKRLSQSKSTIPHAYVTATVPADGIQQLRQRFAKQAELKLSLNDFIIRACAQALRSVPELNVQWRTNSVQQLPSVDISVAVATPNGLITPILFGADRMGVAQISGKLRELATRARDGKLQPPEFQGGTFTISNLGMFGSVSQFTAIINPPQAAILAVGGTTSGGGGAGGEQFSVTLCYDARAVGDADAHRFVQTLKTSMAEPAVLLAGMDIGLLMSCEGEEDADDALEDQQFELEMDLNALEKREDSRTAKAPSSRAASQSSLPTSNSNSSGSNSSSSPIDDETMRMMAKLL